MPLSLDDEEAASLRTLVDYILRDELKYSFESMEPPPTTIQQYYKVLNSGDNIYRHIRPLAIASRYISEQELAKLERGWLEKLRHTT